MCVFLTALTAAVKCNRTELLPVCHQDRGDSLLSECESQPGDLKTKFRNSRVPLCLLEGRTSQDRQGTQGNASASSFSDQLLLI